MPDTDFPNSEQLEVLAHLHGALLVLAPAGTGKTRVMAERLALAIESGVDPNRTLGVTFTNRAADEMRRRVKQRLGDPDRCENIRTFHGLCAWILRQEAKDLGLARDFVVYDEEDSKELLRYCLRDTILKSRDAYWAISEVKSSCPASDLSLSAVPQLNFGKNQPELVAAANQYHAVLAERYALDFSDLIYRVRAMLALMPEKREKWSRRFDWIQVDEVQDTHDSEYSVIRDLGLRTKNVAFFGDVDQTIYEWRGSDPTAVIDEFRREFAPVRERSLAYNYRATRILLQVADRFAETFANRRTRIRAAPNLTDGYQPVFHCAPNPDGEARWVAGQIGAMAAKVGAPQARVGVLARTHKRAQAISGSLDAAGIPHVTVEEFEFFRRQEIKDVLARLRLILNPHDAGALGRTVRRPASGVGEATLRKVWEEGQKIALRITDMARPETHVYGEPYSPLLDGLSRGAVVVLDVETTGLSAADDEIVDVGAVRIENGAIAERFERLVRPTRSVKDSSEVHGLSDVLLENEGQDPRSVFRELRDFIGGAHIVGHNVRFDLSMLRAQGERVGVPLAFELWDDTLEISRRLLALERFDLGTLSRHLRTEHCPSHRALADAKATADVLIALHSGLMNGHDRRQRLVERLGKPFVPIAGALEAWRMAAEKARPADLCGRILVESGLGNHYQGDTRRERHLDDLVRFFRANDRPNAAPRVALEALVQGVSLARNVDHLAADDPRIPIITIHQSKGLEFDVVFVAGVSEGEMPSFYALRDGRLEEERRLFYVAITRAKRELFVSSFEQNDRGYHAGVSQFVNAMKFENSR